MTASEFNDKYVEFLEPGFYGLAIEDGDIVEYLDGRFEILAKELGFSYSQIKLKFGSARVYLSYDFHDEALEMEKYINENLL
jgi:hypothetical protein